MEYIHHYMDHFRQTLDQLPLDRIDEVIGILHATRLRRQTIFIMGNGGSASTATHFVADLSKNTRQASLPDFRVIGLADNMAAFSAYANDEGYENVFARQLTSLVRAGDVVIAISASGNSPNVIKAVEAARAAGAATVGFTGFTGGELGRQVDVHVHVPSQVIEQVEDIHLMFEHMIVKSLRDHAEEIQAKHGLSIGGLSLEQEAERAAPLFNLLAEIGQELESFIDPRGLLQRTLQLSLQGVGAASGSIILLGADGSVQDAALAYGGEVRAPDLDQLAGPLAQGLARWVVENRQPALVSSTRDDPRWLPGAWEAAEEVSRSAISIPLMHGQRVAGVITLSHSQVGRFSHEQLIILGAIAVLMTTSSKLLSIQQA